MLQRFVRIQEEIMEVHADSVINITTNDSVSFSSKVEKYQRMMSEIYLKDTNYRNADTLFMYLLNQYVLRRKTPALRFTDAGCMIFTFTDG